MVQHLPQIRQIAAEVLDFNSPPTRGLGAELLNYGLFIKNLPEVILDAGKQLGVDMTPVCRFVRALDNEPTDEETARMIVDVRVCWDQCEARLRGAADSAENREPCDLTAYRPARELWRGHFTTYKAFTVWLAKHGKNIRRDPTAPKNRLRLHAGEFLAAWDEYERLTLGADGPALDLFKEGAAKRLADLRAEKDRSRQQGK
ncbi:MAG: hypothetical protein NTY19_07155 [Planctomycetota bacterium]|nr:hypothetical protein [Planctomycetota bacterium]